MNEIDMSERESAIKNANVMLGFDGGTSNSLLSLIRKGEKCPKVVMNSFGKATTPSVVCFDTDQKVVVGEAAKNQAIGAKLKRTVCAFKKDILDDKQWQDGKWTGSYPEFNGEATDPMKAAALVLRKMTWESPEVARHAVDGKLCAVICVPAHASVAARARFRQVAEMAKITVIGVIEEPTAAALSYHVENACKGKTAVFDFGGGTLDVSIVSWTSAKTCDGKVEAFSGDPALGGTDIDVAFSYHVYKRYCEQMNPSVVLSLDDFKARHLDELDRQRTVMNFKRVAEEAKIAFTTVEDFDAVFDDGECVISVARQEFEEISRPFVDRAVDVLVATLEKSGYAPEAIDELVLAGGSSYMRIVRETIETRLPALKDKIVLHDPHAAIAVGAAVFAAQIAWGEGGDLEMKAGASYGIKTVRDENGSDVYHISNLIMVGDVLPKSVKEPFRTYRDDQRTVDIELYSNEHADEEVEVSECTEIVNPESNLMDLGRATKKGTTIQVSMELDKSGVLTLIAESEFGYYKRVAHITNSMSAEDVEKAKRQLAAGTVQ